MIKRNIKLIGILILTIIIIFIVIYKCSFSPQKTKKEYSAVLEENLEIMGKDFYENYFYPVVAKDLENQELKTYLMNYEDSGLKVTLDILGKYNNQANSEIIKKFYNDKTGEKCDSKNTYVYIYPKEPYQVNDYDLKVELSCNY